MAMVMPDGRASSMTPAELRRLADVLESRDCSAHSATDCPVHGPCICPVDGPAGTVKHGFAADCPLHAMTSTHTAAELEADIDYPAAVDGASPANGASPLVVVSSRSWLPRELEHNARNASVASESGMFRPDLADDPAAAWWMPAAFAARLALDTRLALSAPGPHWLPAMHEDLTGRPIRAARRLIYRHCSRCSRHETASGSVGLASWLGVGLLVEDRRSLRPDGRLRDRRPPPLLHVRLRRGPAAPQPRPSHGATVSRAAHTAP
jgi:hypothetical protein